MRASPAFQVHLQRFGLWQVAVWSLALSGVAAQLAWLGSRDRPLGAVLLMLSVVTVLAIVGLAATLANVPGVLLRWDGQRWFLGSPASTPAETVPGDLSVAIDLGPWMLLRFTSEAAAQRPRGIWLPAQRRGIEAQWHALRCCVYSPHAAVAPPGTAGKS